MNKVERLKLLKRVGEKEARKRCVAAHAAIDLGQEVVRVRRTILKECSVCGKEFDPTMGRYRGVCSEACATEREKRWRSHDLGRKKERNEAAKAEKRRKRQERILARIVARAEALRRAFGSDTFSIADAGRALGISETPMTDSLESLRALKLVTKTKVGVRGPHIRWMWKMVETNPFKEA